MSANYVDIAGGTTYTLRVNPATLTFQNNQFRLVCKTAGGAITINLPAISAFGNGIDTKIFIEDADENSSVNNITVVCNVANTIANAPSYIINEDGKKVEVYISSFTEFGVLGQGVGGGAGQDTLLGVGAYGEYPIANSPSQVLSASGISKVYAILQLMTNPVVLLPSTLQSIAFPDLTELIGGIDFEDDGTALLETLSFPQLVTNRISTVTISGFSLLNSINFSSIETLLFQEPSGSFTITENDVLTSFSMPSLTDIESTDPLTGTSVLVVSDCPLLESVSYPNLVNLDKSQTGVVAFSNLPLCSSISLPNLTRGFFGAVGTGVVALDSIGLVTSLSLPEALEGITVSIQDCPLLVSVSAPKLLTGGSVSIFDNPALTSLSFPLLASLSTSSIGGVHITRNAILPSFSFPSLTISDFVIITENDSITQALFPSLLTIGYLGLNITDNPDLVSQSFPLLMTIGGDYQVVNNYSLTSLTQPSLLVITNGGVIITDNNALSSINISTLLTSPLNVDIRDNASLTTINIGMALTVQAAGVYDFSSNALTQVSVDDILAKLDSGGLLNRTLNIGGGTNSTPSAGGLVSKANLIGKGWAVTNN